MPCWENHAGEDLLEGCRAGRLEAFERLYEQAGPRMKSLAANLLGNAEDAEDAVQETFLKVYRGAGGFKGSSAASTWAFRILLNTCYDAMRRRRRHPEDAGLDGLDLRLASGAVPPRPA